MSVHYIVVETTEAITTALKEKVFPKLSTEYFKSVANGFESNWNFPNCIGAIDGKHVTIQISKFYLLCVSYLKKIFCWKIRHQETQALNSITTSIPPR